MWFEKLTIGQLADQAGARWPDREALNFEGRRWSYAQFRDEVDKAAKALIAAGIEPGEHVCLWLVNRPEYLFLLYAIAKIGAVQVPINTRFRTHDMSYIVAQSDATTLISADRWGSSGYLEMIEEMVPNLRDQDPKRISAPALPSLRRVILLGDTPVPGTLNWDALLEAGKAVADGELA